MSTLWKYELGNGCVLGFDDMCMYLSLLMFQRTCKLSTEKYPSGILIFHTSEI
jgi:hypothetical protein